MSDQPGDGEDEHTPVEGALEPVVVTEVDDAEAVTEPEPVLDTDATDTAAPAEDPEDDADADDDDGVRSPRKLVLLSVALLVLATGLGAAAATLYSRLQAERGDREDVADVSGRFGEALLSYDYTNLDTAKRRVLADATGRFKAEYERAFTGGLDVLLRETKARSRGTVLDVFVSDIEDDNAKAIAVVTAQAEGIAGRRQAADSYIQLDLVKVKGNWKVDGVTNLNFGQTVPSAAAPTSVPTSTVPPPP